MKKHKLTPVEEALIVLAQYVQGCPYSSNKVEKHILDILGLEKKK